MNLNLKNLFSFLNHKNSDQPVMGKIKDTNFVYEVGQLNQAFFGKDFQASDLAIVMDEIHAELNGANASSMSDQHRENLYKDMEFANRTYTQVTEEEYKPKDPDAGSIDFN